MSRTVRNRKESYFSYYQHSVDCGWHTFTKKEERAYYSDKTNKWYSFSVPKEFRKTVNKQRRARDKHATHNEVYEKRSIMYSEWNCNDNNNWGYW